jgi:hypothetical protein
VHKETDAVRALGDLRCKVQLSEYLVEARIRSKAIHSGLHVGEQKEGLAVTVRFFQTTKCPVSLTQQTIEHRHLCRGA